MIEGTTRPVIVGIDPGTTSAVVVLDLEGELLGHHSTKNFSKDQIIGFIIEHGNPLVLGTDVAHMPSLLRDVASNMGAVRCVPDKDLKTGYKEELAATVGLDTADAHTMDAAAAAVNAYREHDTTLHTIKSRASREDLTHSQALDVAELVLKQGVSTSYALKEVQKSDETDEAAGRDWKGIAGQRQKEIDTLRRKLERLESEHERLRNSVSSQEPRGSGVTADELRERNRVIARLRDSITEKAATIDRLKQENSALRNAVELFREGNAMHIPSVDDLSTADRATVYTDSYRGGPVSKDVDTVVTRSGKVDTRPYKSLREHGVRVVALDELETVVPLGDGYIVDDSTLHDAAEKGESFTQWLEAYRKRQAQ